jgi:SAM-dependent methyltransferase
VTDSQSGAVEVSLGMNLGFWVKRPHLIRARLKYWIWEKRHPDEPWLCEGTVTFLANALTPTMHALEFGSGRSTAWFARRVGSLTSVEHSESWHRKVHERLERDGLSNVDYRLVPLDHAEAEPEQEAYHSRPFYVRVVDDFPDDSLDLVVVDGHYRSACIQACIPKLKPGGMLLVDDVNLWGTSDGVPVPHGWRLAHQDSNGIKMTCIWRKPDTPAPTFSSVGSG